MGQDALNVERRTSHWRRFDEVTIRSAKREVFPDLSEVWSNRYMVAILVWRDIKVRYSHTVLGILWYVLQPFLLMLVISAGFSFVFPPQTNGLPYPVFVASGLIVWQYFSNAFMVGALSFQRFEGIINKVYIHKLALPLTSIIASLADLLAASLLLVPLMVFYRLLPSWRIIFVPTIIAGIFVFVGGLVLALSVACTKYKDFRHVLPFATQILFFASPIFYPHDVLSPRVKLFFGMNPLAGYVTAFRWALFDNAQPPELTSLVVTISVSIALFLIGLLYFQRFQGDLVDII